MNSLLNSLTYSQFAVTLKSELIPAGNLPYRDTTVSNALNLDVIHATHISY